jgi:hypothetical protein
MDSHTQTPAACQTSGGRQMEKTEASRIKSESLLDCTIAEPGHCPIRDITQMMVLDILFVQDFSNDATL